MNYVIEPLIGINDVKIGISQSAVRRLLGEPESSDKRVDRYNESIFQIHYGGDGLVRFIEVYEDGGIVANIGSTDVFRTKKNDLVELLQSQYQGVLETDDFEHPHCHTYKNIGVGFWSDSHPDDFSSDEIQEHPEDYKSSFFFKSIGIGSSNYYA